MSAERPLSIGYDFSYTGYHRDTHTHTETSAL